MTDTEIEAYRKKLNDLTTQYTNEKTEKSIYPELYKLAKEIGASTRVFFCSPFVKVSNMPNL